ncbi:glycoside hydrolase family 140 protein [Microlunatus soli]|uniref:Putative collagen-binding domain of a collagenase n=1 Tax=Microlunatus soli TaxID=630515 RepID=A0A1H1WBH1_9ACTN|nr:glycoside hydrolase family 140 protein [Microlunatus soli]SDS94322.1 Putative collagen-binding domain of a collagenase [Microlunatus soli]
MSDGTAEIIKPVDRLSLTRRTVLAAGVATWAGSMALDGGTATADEPTDSSTDKPADSSTAAAAKPPWEEHGPIRISDNGRFFQHQDGEPFFWLADTPWLLHKLSREELPTYFEDRRDKGFNVALLQVVPASLAFKNYYGDTPFIGQNMDKPNEPYWEHVDAMVELAAEYGLYMGMDAVWGSVVKSGALTVAGAKRYGTWIAERYRHAPNIVWLIGGDTIAHERLEIWTKLGEAVRQVDPDHLITFHPFGRYSSATWFHNADWLDFHLFQSGHRTYAQAFAEISTEETGVQLPTLWKGEDNWKFVLEDHKLYPPKPTLDGEPSYERVPQGLHDLDQPFWKAEDIRRYAYWAVFAGACGHSYGNGAVMPMHVESDGPVNGYGVRKYWYQGLDDPGAGQLQYLKKLILSRPYFSRIYDPSIVHGDAGWRYDRILTTRGNEYLFAYSYTGRSFSLEMGHISGNQVKVWWYNTRNGASRADGTRTNSGIQTFNPPGGTENGNDWVLVLDDADMRFDKPGTTPSPWN